MNQDKESQVEVRKKEVGKSASLKGCYVEFSVLSPHLPGLGTGKELCWFAPHLLNK